jgi:4-amino-4-deoxy-L-arabinose transferase-like glycosyltransferase
MRSWSSTLAQIALVAALTATLYSIGLATSPPHLTHDEIKFALQAKSIADTGRDINGRLLPLYFLEPGFSVGRDPICIYVMAAVLRVAPLSETSIRFSTVLAGALGVGLVFVLARQVFPGLITPAIVAAILALSPTYFIHSRLALSVVYPVPFTILWLILLRRYFVRQRPRDGLALGVALGAGVYSYLAAALMMPVYLAATTVLLARRRDWRAIRLMIGGFALMLLPLIAWQAIEPNRYANILSAYRLYDHDPASQGGALQQLMSGSGLVDRVDVLWDAFNPAGLFFTGESSLQISTREVGSLLTPVAVFLVIGLMILAGRGAPAADRLFVFGLLSAPLPAVIMADVEIRRWLVLLPFVAIAAGFGVERLRARGRRGAVIIAMLLVLMALQFMAFTRDYFGAYRERASIWFGGNIRAAVESVLDEARQRPPSAVYIATEIPWVDAYWQFYSLVHGQDLHDRTRFVRLQLDGIPPATPGAVILTPAVDPALTENLYKSGWASLRTIPDLDGRPSLTVATAALP